MIGVAGGEVQQPESVQIQGNREFGGNRTYKRETFKATISGAGPATINLDETFPEDVDLYGGGFEVRSGTPHEDDEIAFKVVHPTQGELGCYLEGEPCPDAGAQNKIELKPVDLGLDMTEIPAGLKLRVEFTRAAGAAAPDHDLKVKYWYHVRRHT